MNVRDWTAFLAQDGGTLRLAQISEDLASAVGAVSSVVHLEQSYATKIAHKHQLQPQHFPMLDETIDQGAVVRDGKQHLAFFYFDQYVFKRWFRATVKRCNERRMLWITTFHKTDIAQARSKMRRLPVLRSLRDG